MGYMRHHAIILTCYEAAPLKRALEKARELEMSVTGITEEVVNGYRSAAAMPTFLVAPDGSKEGWGASERGNQQRDALIAYLRSDPFVRALDWAEVQFGDEGGENLVTRDSGRISLVSDRLMGGPAKGSRE